MFSTTMSWLGRLSPWLLISGLAYAAVFIKPTVDPAPLSQPLLERRDAFFDGAVHKDNFWVVGQNGALLATTDAGQRWNREELPGRDNLQSIAVSDSGRVVVVGNQGRLWTREPGQPWQSHSLPVAEHAGKLLSVAFIDNQFWVAGEMGALFRGDAQAQNWQALGIDEDVTFNAIRPGANGDLWLAAEFGRLLRSRDHGQTWVSQELGSESLRSIAFEGSTGVAVGNRGEAYLTLDAGDSWQAIPKFTSEHLFDVVVHQGQWVATGDRGALMRSSDPAADWQAWTPPALDKSYHSRLLATHDGVILIGQQIGLLTKDELEIWPAERAQ
jgi:photosystem II stability/assembly factor-like uncharacterized protein